MDDISLVIDVGTSSVRVSAITGELKTIASAISHRSIEAVYPAEDDWSLIDQLVRQVVSRAGPRYTGICCSALLGWIAADKSGRALTGCMTYMHKLPHLAGQMRSRIDAEQYYRLTGRRLEAESGLLKLMEIQQNQPHLYDDIHAFYTLKDYINCRLTGEFAIDATSACYSGAYALEKEGWAADLLEAWRIDARKLTNIVACNKPVGQLQGPLARSWGLEHCPPVYAGAPDGSTGIAGVGALSAGQAACIMGTTGVFFGVSEAPVKGASNQALASVPHPFGERYLVGGPMGFSGGTLGWLSENILGGRHTLAELDAQARELPPGSDGLLFIPSLTGERTPFWNEHIRGTIVGLGIKHGAAHLHRAIMEANAFTQRRILDLALENGFTPSGIIAGGGGAQSDLWLQIIADVTGVAVMRSPIKEATSAGCARLVFGAQAGAHHGAAVPDFVPRQQRHRAYQPHYSQYLRLIARTGSFYNEFAQDLGDC